MANAAEMGAAYVVQLQQQLLLHGYDPGPANGEPGPRTRVAVAQYKRDAEMRRDATLEDVLARLLYGAPDIHAKRRAAKGPEPRVAAAQIMLRRLGWYDGAVDGREGAETIEAVALFAIAHGSTATSIAEIYPLLESAALGSGRLGPIAGDFPR
jgi:peptidoglycan hydrolase-like protein with peptidoglycan-binding domain